MRVTIIVTELARLVYVAREGRIEATSCLPVTLLSRIQCE